jgi:phosphonatase-like hydrolase
MIGPFTLACLDMAGTTVRDDGAVEDAFVTALGAVGIVSGTPEFDRAEDLVRETMGWSKADVFAALLGTGDDAARATQAFASAYEATVAAGHVAAMPGALDVLRELRRRGVRVCLTTGFAPSTRDALLGALGWSDEVDLALSPADVGRGRPAPDLVLGAMERLGVTDPRAVVVVGDTVSDLEAGAAASAGAVVGVLSGAHDEQTLREAPHTAVITDVTALIGELERVGGGRLAAEAGGADPPPAAP